MELVAGTAAERDEWVVLTNAMAQMHAADHPMTVAFPVLRKTEEKLMPGVVELTERSCR